MHQRLGRWRPVPLPVDRPCIHPDPDRYATFTRTVCDQLDLIRIGDVPRIEAQLIHTLVNRRQRKPVVKVDVCRKRDVYAILDLAERAGGGRIRNGDANQVAACFFKLVDLGNRGPDICRCCVGHGLHRHRGAAADKQVAHAYLSGLPPCLHRGYLKSCLVYILCRSRYMIMRKRIAITVKPIF